jgi:hypothetical protein
MIDQLVAEAANCTIHNKHKTQTSMPLARFEPSISASEWPPTYALELTATGIGICCNSVVVMQANITVVIQANITVVMQGNITVVMQANITVAMHANITVVSIIPSCKTPSMS